ncbi:uncharacterized protein LOC143764461 [Ranitomeya variabilis]|uniref:uncharacterized protein LOC143764461 n=1 Tax=Ranitomeya variabilis TaxID=490064 RepID=UPI00405683E9
MLVLTWGELLKILQRAVDFGIISIQVRDILLIKDPRVPTLYLLPKVHKDVGNPPGQFLRIKRICTSTEDFELRASEMMNRFRERGYSRRCLKKAYNRARNTGRHQLLYSPRTDKPDTQLGMITCPYSAL